MSCYIMQNYLQYPFAKCIHMLYLKGRKGLNELYKVYIYYPKITKTHILFQYTSGIYMNLQQQQH